MPHNAIAARARRAWLAVFCAALIAPAALGAGQQQASGLDFVLGTWTGTSTCVGNGPACRNEVVVYRFEPVEGHPDQVRLYADKIVEGKRLPMGALLLTADAQRKSVKGQFTRRQTTGEWSFTVKDDSMTGALHLLPGRSVVRDVKVKRARESEVPAAPALSEYEE